jgi:hypothetical protein
MLFAFIYSEPTTTSYWRRWVFVGLLDEPLLPFQALVLGSVGVYFTSCVVTSTGTTVKSSVSTDTSVISWPSPTIFTDVTITSATKTAHYCSNIIVGEFN